MLRAIAGRLTYANVVSTLCLFVVLGGGAYAATQIDGKLLKKRSVPGNRIKKNGLGGKEIKEAKLARVPDAGRLAGKLPTAFLGAGQKAKDSDRLDGADASAFVRQGGGTKTRVIAGAVDDRNSHDYHDILDIPGVGGLDVNCTQANEKAQLVFTYTPPDADQSAVVSLDIGTGDPETHSLNKFDQLATPLYKPPSGTDHYTFHIYAAFNGFPPRHVVLIEATLLQSDFTCGAWATAVDQVVEE